MSTSVRRFLAVALCAAALPSALSAQKGAKEPKRPKLSAQADTNEWKSYYDYGVANVRTMPGRAADGFYWAMRLNPSRAEPWYGRWVALWMAKPEMLSEYWKGAEFVVNSGDAQRIDSLKYQALLRNPFVFQGLERLRIAAVFDHEYGQGQWEWSAAPEISAWLAYTEGAFPEATRRFQAAIAREPRAIGLHEDRARAFFAMQAYDSAAREMQVLIDALKRLERRRLTYFYQSKAMYEYSVGVTYVARQDFYNAREAFSRALSEDLGFYMAHGALGAASLVQGDTATAITEYEQAVQINGEDPVLRHDFGVLLMAAGRNEEAVEHLAKSIALEPYFASPYFFHAFTLDRLGKGPEAAAQYQEFLRRAPRSMGQQITVAQQRLAALGKVAGGR